MKLPLSWIQEFIEINLPAHRIAEILTLAGLEVDGCSPLPLPFESIVVAEITEVEPHPDAEKLSIATVFDGEQSYQVVCGAANCRPGLKTAFAKIGAVLMDENNQPFKIKKTKLRGVESFGMLCAEDELGLGGDSSGIMEFSDLVSVGADIAEIYGDTIFDISLTPNLNHCSSVLGVARELAASTEKEILRPTVKISCDESQPIDSAISVNVKDFKKCPRYACRLIKSVKVGPSPDWLQRRLIACDQRPVNNVVDATNFILLEQGHPLHAFDFDLLEGQQIKVRRAGDGEKFVTLDEKERLLTKDDLMICDSEKPVAIAGIMGGLNSEVNSHTTNVLLESAYFDPTGIRRTSKRLNLQTEASRRFERGADPNQVLTALDRAAAFIQEICGGSICEGIIDQKQGDFPRKEVTCRLSRINAVLGTQIGMSEVENIFLRLGFSVEWDGKNVFMLSIPTYRVDISQEIDLIEEVARIYGFDSIPKHTPSYRSSGLPHAPIFLFEREVRSRLIASGLQEFLTCDLIGPKLLETINGPVMPEENVVRVINPTSIEQSVLRTSLLPGLLQVAKHNYDRECHHVSGFEVGRVHFKEGDQYCEQSMAAILMMGNRNPIHWERVEEEVDFFDLKGVIESLLREAGIQTFDLKNLLIPHFHPGRQGSLFVDDIEVGTIGELHPAILRRLDVPKKIYYAEIDLHLLYRVRKTEFIMREIPVYPASDRDLTITIGESQSFQEILDSIDFVNSRLLEKVILIDIYRGKQVSEGNKNMTLRFVYRNVKKTISQEAVDAEHARITSQIESRVRR